MLTTVLFDMDGTLLPMDTDAFTRGYFGLLTRALAPRGYDPKRLVDAVWAGTKAMVENDGTCLNEEVFWRTMRGLYGPEILADKPAFDAFYETDFEGARAFTGVDPLAARTVDRIRSAGLRTALATNPFFPMTAQCARLRWAGLDPDRFELITSYENSRRCKPNPGYFLDVCAALGVRPEECLMVGNDVDEDMVARETGMRVFLMTGCLLNRHGADTTAFPQGGFAELTAYLGLDKNAENLSGPLPEGPGAGV